MSTTTDEPGILITRVRGYNLFTALFFGGRRGAINRRLADVCDVRPGERIVDVGCGPGIFARILAGRTGPGGQVTGVDPSAPMIDHGRRGAPDNCRFLTVPAQDLTLPDSSVDLVTCTFAMHHIPKGHRATALAQMHRVLCPGGRLLIADLYPRGRLVPAAIRRAKRGDPFAELDVATHAPTLGTLGFTGLRYGIAGPWTRYLTATKPT